MNNGIRAVVLSLLTVLLCGIVLAVGILALPSGKTTVNYHLSAGNLQVGLYRKGYTAYALNDSGEMQTATDTQRVNLVQDASPLFEVKKALPGNWYQADLEVVNEGSVEISYGVKLLWSAEEKTEAEQLFAQQLYITLSYGEPQEAKGFLLANCNDLENVLSLGVLPKNAVGEVRIKAEFLHQENNDLVQKQNIVFDVQVFATQYVATQKAAL